MSHAVIVVNRRAGAGAPQVDALTRQLRAQIGAQGIAATVIGFAEPTAAADDWRQRLANALARGCGRVYVLGGDGTVLAVAAQLTEQSTPLAIIPLGTANLLARDLGIPLQPGPALECVANLPDTAAHRIDIARVNGHPFLCASMIGLTTTLARTREAVRGQGLVRAAIELIRKAIWLLRRYPYRRVRMLVDGMPTKVKTRALVITNNPIDAVVRPYPSRASLNTGLLGVYGIRQGPLWELPRVAVRLLQGNWQDDPRIFHYRASALTLETHHEHDLTVMNDGERLHIRTPLHYQSLAAALPVLVPQRSTGTNAATRAKGTGIAAPAPAAQDGFTGLLGGGRA
jgi:diacylglycerol kinase family enzyme